MRSGFVTGNPLPSRHCRRFPYSRLHQAQIIGFFIIVLNSVISRSIDSTSSRIASIHSVNTSSIFPLEVDFIADTTSKSMQFIQFAVEFLNKFYFGEDCPVVGVFRPSSFGVHLMSGIS